MRGVAIRDAGQHVRDCGACTSSARRRRLARAQQLATAEEDQWQAMEQVWLILQLFMSEDESVQAGEKAKNAGPVVAKTRLVVGSLDRVWRKFIHVHGGKVGLKPLPAAGFVEVI